MLTVLLILNLTESLEEIWKNCSVCSVLSLIMQGEVTFFVHCSCNGIVSVFNLLKPNWKFVGIYLFYKQYYMNVVFI